MSRSSLPKRRQKQGSLPSRSMTMICSVYAFLLGEIYLNKTSFFSIKQILNINHENLEIIVGVLIMNILLSMSLVRIDAICRRDCHWYYSIITTLICVNTTCWSAITGIIGRGKAEDNYLICDRTSTSGINVY